MDSFIGEASGNQGSLAQEATSSWIKKNLEELLKEAGISGQVVFYGASYDGFPTGETNLDVSILTGGQHNRQETAALLRKIARFAGAYHFDNVTPILNANIPVLKLTNGSTGTEVDITVDNLSAFWGSKLLRLYSKLDDRILELGKVVKSWARNQDLVGAPSDGYLDASTFIHLVIYFLQVGCHLPIAISLQMAAKGDGKEDGASATDHQPWKTERGDFVMRSHARMERVAQEMAAMEQIHFYSQNAEMNIEKLLHSFFDFYVNVFQWNDHVVSVRLGTPFVKKSDLECFKSSSQAEYGQWCIEDPFDFRTNFAASSSKAAKKRILNEMNKAMKKLRKSDAQSIFRPLPGTETYVLACCTANSISIPRLMEAFEENGLVKIHHPHLPHKSTKKYSKLTIFLEFETWAGRRKAFAKMENVLGATCSVDVSTQSAMADVLSASTYTTSNAKLHQRKEAQDGNNIPVGAQQNQKMNPLAAPFFPQPQAQETTYEEYDWQEKRKRKDTQRETWNNWKPPWVLHELRSAPGSAFTVPIHIDAQRATKGSSSKYTSINNKDGARRISLLSRKTVGYPPGLGPDYIDGRSAHRVDTPGFPSPASEGRKYESSNSSGMGLREDANAAATLKEQVADAQKVIEALMSQMTDRSLLDMLPIFAMMLRSANLPHLHLEAMSKIRRLLAEEPLVREKTSGDVSSRNPALEVIRANLAPEILNAAKNPSATDLQQEAISVLRYLLLRSTSDTTPELVNYLINNGGINVLNEALGNKREQVKEDAMLCIAYIAQESAASRDELIAQGTVEQVLHLLSPRPSAQSTEGPMALNQKLLRNASCALSRLCSGHPRPRSGVATKCFPTLARLVRSNDRGVFNNSKIALINYIDVIGSAKAEQIEEVLTVPMLSSLLELLKVGCDELEKKTWDAMLNINAVGSESLVAGLRDIYFARALIELLFAEDADKVSKVTKGLNVLRDILIAGARVIDKWNHTLLVTKLEALAYSPTQSIRELACSILTRHVPGKEGMEIPVCFSPPPTTPTTKKSEKEKGKTTGDSTIVNSSVSGEKKQQEKMKGKGGKEKKMQKSKNGGTKEEKKQEKANDTLAKKEQDGANAKKSSKNKNISNQERITVMEGKSSIDSTSNDKGCVEGKTSVTIETGTLSTSKMESLKPEPMPKAGQESGIAENNIRSTIQEQETVSATISSVNLKSIRGMAHYEFIPARTIDPFDPEVQPKMVEAHSLGICKPCAFNCHKTDGICRRGKDCNFCHLCGPNQLKEKRKRKKKLKRWKAGLRNRLKRLEELDGVKTEQMSDADSSSGNESSKG